MIKLFVAGSTARAAAEIIGINKHMATTYFMRLRQLISLTLSGYELSGEVIADESYLGGVRKGIRGRGEAGKVAVFGLLKRGGKVYTAIIPDVKTKTLIPIIREKVEPDSIVYTGNLRSYNALDVSEFHHLRSTTQSSSPIKRITSMESRISGTKRSVICAVSMASRKIAFTGF